MSHFLNHLAVKSLKLAPVIRPRTASFYEPMPRTGTTDPWLGGPHHEPDASALHHGLEDAPNERLRVERDPVSGFRRTTESLAREPAFPVFSKEGTQRAEPGSRTYGEHREAMIDSDREQKPTEPRRLILPTVRSVSTDRDWVDRRQPHQAEFEPVLDEPTDARASERKRDSQSRTAAATEDGGASVSADDVTAGQRIQGAFEPRIRAAQWRDADSRPVATDAERADRTRRARSDEQPTPSLDSRFSKRETSGEVRHVHVPIVPAEQRAYLTSRRPHERPEPTPTIHVTIGRLEVRATPPLQRPEAPRSTPSVTSLSDYLKRRDGEEGR